MLKVQIFLIGIWDSLQSESYMHILSIFLQRRQEGPLGPKSSGYSI